MLVVIMTAMIACTALWKQQQVWHRVHGLAHALLVVSCSLEEAASTPWRIMSCRNAVMV